MGIDPPQPNTNSETGLPSRQRDSRGPADDLPSSEHDRYLIDDARRQVQAASGRSPVQDQLAAETEKLKSSSTGYLNALSISGYRIIRQVSCGGQGIVYEALQESTKRKVAIKILAAGRNATNKARKRFEREIELIAQLRHPNIVSIFHSGETEEGLQYFVMDYVRGLRLDAYVREKNLELEDLLTLFAKVCDAIQYAHQRGIIHRDLKPSNILVDASGSPKVLDFGLAKFMASPIDTIVTMSEEVFGTLQYMSPEQVRGNLDEVDTRTDTYTLGVVLYKLLTGDFPYGVEGAPTAVFHHILDSPPTPLTRSWSYDAGIRRRSGKRLRAGDCPIDGEVETIVLKALAKEPHRRYQSSGELARDIRHWLSNEPIDAKRDSRSYILWKTICRYKVPVVAGSAIVLLLAISSVAVSVLYVKAETARQSEAQKSAQIKDLLVASEKQTEDARRHAYAAQVSLAQQAWEKADVAQVRRLLDSQRPAPGDKDIRGFEWHYLWHLCTSELETLQENNIVRSVAFSPDGKYLAACVGLEVILRDLDTKATKRLTNHSSLVNTAVFSPDSSMLATGSQDRTLRLWNVENGHEIVQAETGIIRSAAFSPDGTTLAAVGYSTDNHSFGGLWALPNLEKRHELELRGSQFYVVRFTPDGQQLLTSGADGYVRYWSAADGRCVRELAAHDRDADAFALSPDGRILATAGIDKENQAQLRLWDAASGELLGALQGHREYITALEFSPTSNVLLSTSADRTAGLWDIESRQRIRTIRGHSNQLLTGTFSPDGETFATGSGDKTVKIWSVNTQQGPLRLTGHEKPVNCLAVLPNDGLVASGSEDKTVRLWSLEDRTDTNVYPGHEYPVRLLDFSPTERLLVTVGVHRPIAFRDGQRKPLWQEVVSELLWWNVDTGTLRHRERLEGKEVRGIDFSSDGHSLATVVNGPAHVGNITFWDTKTFRRTTSPPVLTSNAPAPQCVTHSPDGKWLAVGREGGLVVLWNLPASRDYELQAHDRSIEAARFSEDGLRLATADTTGRLILWDVETGEILFSTQAHTLSITDVAFSADGNTVATAGGWDGRIRLWDVHLGMSRGQFELPNTTIRAIEFSPDGSRLVAAGSDTIWVWEHARR